MNTKYITLTSLALAALTLSAHAQILVPIQRDPVIGHWDMNDGSTSYASSAIPEASPNHCVSLSDMTALRTGSYSTVDSEDSSINSGANCFAGTTSTGANNVITFKITTGADAVGDISRFNFDIANYNTTSATGPTDYRVTVLQNGTQAAQSSWIAIDGLTDNSNTGSWTGGFNENLYYASNLLSTSSGTSDMFEFQIEVQGGASAFALDNVRIYGDITCVPEPSTALLGALALGGSALIRRRN